MPASSTPPRGREERGGVLVDDGMIAAGRASGVAACRRRREVIDCGGQVLAPGLIDMRAFIGEPGAEHRETLHQRRRGRGGRRRHHHRHDARHRPGRSTIRPWSISSCAAPATPPSSTSSRRRRSPRASPAGDDRVRPAQRGRRRRLHRRRAARVTNAQVMRRALTYARDFGALIVHHTEDADLVGTGRDERRRVRQLASALPAFRARPRPSCSSATCASCA